MIHSRYTRVTRTPIPPDVTVCERIATNQRGSLRYLIMNELAATPDVSVWTGAASGVTGTHQAYRYEAEAEGDLPFPVVIQYADGSGVDGLAVGLSASLNVVAGDMILAFMNTVGGTDPYFWWGLAAGITSTQRTSVTDTGITEFETIDIPSTPVGVDFFIPSTGNSLFVGQALHIRGGVYSNSQSAAVAGAAPTANFTPTFDGSQVFCCFTAHGTAGFPVITPEATESWTIHGTIQRVNAGGTLYATQVLCGKQVQSAGVVAGTAAVTGHDGNTTITFAAIRGDGIELDNIWQQWILMKDVDGTYTPGEVLSI